MKPCELPQEVLLEEFIKKVKHEVLEKMPRLANEPFSEYNEHIREEVEFAACSLVSKEIDKKFGVKKNKWNGF